MAELKLPRSNGTEQANLWSQDLWSHMREIRQMIEQAKIKGETCPPLTLIDIQRANQAGIHRTVSDRPTPDKGRAVKKG